MPLRVSTHSRPKAAAFLSSFYYQYDNVSTHSRPKAAAYALHISAMPLRVSTHSRPKAAATYLPSNLPRMVSFNTQPPEGGCRGYTQLGPDAQWVSTHSRPKAAANSQCLVGIFLLLFQHTAARRRLLKPLATAK